MSLTRVPLTDEEKLDRSRQLAQAIRERTLMDLDHEERRKDMTKERKELERRIVDLADVVRTGAEDRSEQLGMFP